MTGKSGAAVNYFDHTSFMHWFLIIHRSCTGSIVGALAMSDVPGNGLFRTHGEVSLQLQCSVEGILCSMSGSSLACNSLSQSDRTQSMKQHAKVRQLNTSSTMSSSKIVCADVVGEGVATSYRLRWLFCWTALSPVMFAALEIDYFLRVPLGLFLSALASLPIACLPEARQFADVRVLCLTYLGSLAWCISQLAG